MSEAVPTVALAGALGSLLLQGCGTPPVATTTVDYYNDPNTTTNGPYTTTTTTELATNIWQWRRDMLMHQQISWDVSDNRKSYGYEPCWAKGGHTISGGEEMLWTPMDEQFSNDGTRYGSYDGETGVTLINKQAEEGQLGCLMRKTRYPIDFSVIGQIEFDVSSSGGSSAGAPWSAIWFAPMVYYEGGWPERGSLALAAEIDIIENFAGNDGPGEFNLVSTQFSMCKDPAHCKPFSWGPVIKELNHHVSMKMTWDGETRSIKIVKCEQPAKKCDVDGAAEFAELRSHDSYPVWNKANAKNLYGKYWMVNDIWYTSGTDFRLSVGNISFAYDNGTEWKMPLGGKPFLNEDFDLVTTTMSPPDADDDTTMSPEVMV